jgi:hypothetical protein
MMDIAKFEDLNDLVIQIRGASVLLDAGVAVIYGVETRDINKAVTNNPDKFPAGYIIELSKAEKIELVENFHRFDRLKHSTVKQCHFKALTHNPSPHAEVNSYCYVRISFACPKAPVFHAVFRQAESDIWRGLAFVGCFLNALHG